MICAYAMDHQTATAAPTAPSSQHDRSQWSQAGVVIPSAAGSTPPILPDGYTVTLSEPSSIICVTNLPQNANRNDLVKLFTSPGKVEHAEVKFHPDGRSTCVGLVEFRSQIDATTAVAKLADYGFGNRALKLCYVKCTSPHIRKHWYNDLRLSTDPQSTTTTTMITASTSASEEGRKVGLLYLPQELEDIIFNLAYPCQPDAIWLDHNDWVKKERSKQRADRTCYTTRAFPRTKVHEFLVSKQYFVAAARAWVGNQKIDTERSPAFDFVPTGMAGGIVSAYVVDMRCSLYNFIGTRMVYLLPRLVALEIVVDYWKFESVKPRTAWDDELTVQDFNEVEAVMKLTYLSGLRKFKLIPDRCYHADTEAQKERWARNVQAFEDLLRPYVVGKRLPEASAIAEKNNEGRLYTESVIRF